MRSRFLSPSTARLVALVGASLAAALGATGCADATPPTGPALQSAPPALTIADASHGGQAGFYFLPPLVKAPSYSGQFDAALTPEVRICALVAGGVAGLCSGADLVVLTTTGTGAATIHVDAAGEAYTAVWHTRGVGLNPNVDYRLRVSVGTRLLGVLDLDVVANAQGLKTVPDAKVGLVQNHPLQVKFRVETGIVGQVVVTPSTASTVTGGTQQFSATLTDLHGQALSGPAVVWSSSNTAVATVSASGLATAVSAGTTTIIATSQGLTGMATLSVEHTVTGTLTGGGGQMCALTAAGAAYCWGLNYYGQVGDGSSTNRHVPTAAVGGISFKQLAAGGEHTCGLTPTGVAYCWGWNAFGQLGDGTNANRPVPTVVAGGLTFQQLTAGGQHTCGLTLEGTVYCWGQNYNGELGDGTTADRALPTAITGGLTFEQLSSGWDHVCAVTTAGEAYCWGANFNGQVGDGMLVGVFANNRNVPTPVVGGLAFREIRAAGFHTCGITASDAAYCWGRNSNLELGSGNSLDRSYPTAVSGGLSFDRLSSGGMYHTCGLTTAGVAYCWGSNNRGQLGDGTTVNRQSPTAVAGGLVFRQLAAAEDVVCGQTPAGAAYCWGWNVSGQLGDGTTVDRHVPTLVSGGLVFR